jgi:hypothetical protein
MITRRNRVTVTFEHPFSLKGVDRPLAPGQYEVVSDEELIEQLSFPVYRRVSALIFLPPHGTSSIAKWPMSIQPTLRPLRSVIGFYHRPR